MFKLPMVWRRNLPDSSATWIFDTMSRTVPRWGGQQAPWPQFLDVFGSLLWSKTLQLLCWSTATYHTAKWKTWQGVNHSSLREGFHTSLRYESGWVWQKNLYNYPMLGRCLLKILPYYHSLEVDRFSPLRQSWSKRYWRFAYAWWQTHDIQRNTSIHILYL